MEGATVVEQAFVSVWAPQTIPDTALKFGFEVEPVGTHISRTMMLNDLRRLLIARPAAARPADYAAAVVDDNVLLKPTISTRRRSLRRLNELYRLDRRVLLFRALRDLWDDDASAQPLLAALCATATDPLLRNSSDLLLSLPFDEEVTPELFSASVSEQFPDRYSPVSVASIGRNIASSWQQSGHLRGKMRKFRAHAESRPSSVVYALLLGYLCGGQGEALFHTLWCRLLDAPGHVLHAQAFAAAQRGWLEYRRAGDVTELGFRHLLRDVD